MSKQKITKQIKQIILEKAITEANFAGMWMMNLLPKSVDKLKSLEIKTKDEQQLRSIITEYDNRTFILFLIDGINNHIWAIWEVIETSSKYAPEFTFGKGIWKGCITEQ